MAEKTKSEKLVGGLLGGLKKAYTKAHLKKMWDALPPEEQHRLMALPREERVRDLQPAYETIKAAEEGITPEEYRANQQQKGAEQQQRIAESVARAQQQLNPSKEPGFNWKEALLGREGRLEQAPNLTPEQLQYQNQLLQFLGDKQSPLWSILNSMGKPTPQQEQFYGYVNNLANNPQSLYSGANASIAPGAKNFLNNLGTQQIPQGMSNLLGYLRR